MLEREAYKQMAKPGNHNLANFKHRALTNATGGGIAIHDSNIDTRKGMTFQTPLSRRTAMPTLFEYVKDLRVKNVKESFVTS